MGNRCNGWRSCAEQPNEQLFRELLAESIAEPKKIVSLNRNENTFDALKGLILPR